jgi:FlaA1/EpsC-like NDP-sugar epimerase
MMIRIEKNILIVGAGSAGHLLSQDIRKHYPQYRISGFIDDRPDPTMGDILGKIDDFADVISKYLIDEIIIAIPSADGKLIRRILLANADNRIPIKIVPRDQRIIGQEVVRYKDIKFIESEDFLGRPFVRHDIERLKEFYAGKTVFVTGGAGSIGSEIVRQLIDLEAKKVIVYDNSEYLIFMLQQQLKETARLHRCELIIGSILNEDKIDRLLRKLKPDLVFHAGAYKHVPLMQENIDEAINNNVLGTKCVVDAAIKNKVPLFTFISTDKVVNPTSVMGATKKLCEFYIGAIKSDITKFNIVRFGNVINSNGSALPLFERQMDTHRYVTVTDKNMQRFFMSIREAAQLVIETTASDSLNHIHVLNMGELINIHDVALSLIRAKNFIPGEDVEVRVTGLRQGEKMIEELYTEAEAKNLRKTKNNRIFSLIRTEKCPQDIHKVISAFVDMIGKNENQNKLHKQLNAIFPSLKLPEN